MSSALHHPVFDEPDAAEPGQKPKRFKVAPTFVIDLAFSALCLAGSSRSGASRSQHGAVRRSADLGAAGPHHGLLFRQEFYGHSPRRQGRRRAHLCQIRRAGDDRPLRLVAPSDLCAGDAAIPAVGGPRPLRAGVRAVQRVRCGWRSSARRSASSSINDLVVMPTEEAMLRRLHPEEFDAYAARVNRWFGRRAR